MSINTFTLKPFFPLEPEPLGIIGAISRENGQLHISFTLSGPLDCLILPPTTKKPERKDNLWEDSCFEFFFAELGSDGYYEVNMAPSGHWNVFRFDYYRRGMRVEKKVASVPGNVVRRLQTFSLEAGLDLECLGLANKPLQVNVCAVLLLKSNKQYYWALAHPSSKPDFHDRKGFTLTL